jgi:hypothetical protein
MIHFKRFSIPLNPETCSEPEKMYVIVNEAIPEKAIITLEKYADVIPFNLSGQAYPSIAAHPDIFFCRVNDAIVCAPNIPQSFLNRIENLQTKPVTGKNFVGNAYPETACYNAVITDSLLIHNLNLTDPEILSQATGKEQIHVNQGYCRCNLLPLRDNHFITSDQGIYQALAHKGFKTLFVDPADVLLPGFKNGFFGGTCGVVDDVVFFMGSLKKFGDGGAVQNFLDLLNYQVVELYDGQLFDCGSLLFLK